MSEADLFRGWASQGKKKSQPASGAGEKKPGEKVFLKHLKVNTKPQFMRISALFNENAPDTLIGYRAATILGLKGVVIYSQKQRRNSHKRALGGRPIK